MTDLADIEDLGTIARTDVNHERDGVKRTTSLILPKSVGQPYDKERKQAVGYDIPGIQTVFLKTYGCSHNQSDSEYMAGQLVDYGYKVTEVFEEADVYLINSCTVKSPSQDAFIHLLRRAKDTKKPVIVAGCVPQGDPSHPEWQDISVIGVQQIHRVVEVVEESLRGHTVKFLQRGGKANPLPSLSLPKIRKNRWVEIVPINQGCLNNCTYCKTKHARGNLKSYPIEEIVERVRTVITEGVKEIRLTSEDTGAYGRDIGTNIVELLRGLTGLLDEHGDASVRLRVGMTNPPYILEHLDDIAAVLAHPNVYAFLHLPVQSGSDKVLADMKREYTVPEFCRVVDTLQAKVPNMLIATDIICGFPTETEADFEQTLRLVERYRFPVLNISQFYPRPGTPAAKMKRLPTDTVKARSRALTALFESYLPYQHLLGSLQTVLITELAYDGQSLVGHNKAYVQVLVSPTEAALGDLVEVLVVEAGKFHVKGKVQRVLMCGSSTALPATATFRKQHQQAALPAPMQNRKSPSPYRMVIMLMLAVVTILCLLWA